MGHDYQEMERFKSVHQSLGRVKEIFLGHFGHVLNRFRPVLSISAPGASLGGSHRQGPNGPKMA